MTFTKISPDSKYSKLVSIQNARVDQLLRSLKPAQASWHEIKATRNRLLAQSDWTQAADSPLSAEKRAEWATYRQALRDLPATQDVNSVIWPVPPS